MDRDSIFLGVAAAIVIATVGLLVTRNNPKGRWSNVFLAVAIVGIAILLLAAGGLVVSVLMNPSD